MSRQARSGSTDLAFAVTMAPLWHQSHKTFIAVEDVLGAVCDDEISQSVAMLLAIVIIDYRMYGVDVVNL